MKEQSLEENKSTEKNWFYQKEKAKVVTKPWGKEIWINYREGEKVGDEEKRYVLKKLYINAGTRTSFQYHEKKVETNFLISGRVEAWFENESGGIEKRIIEAGGIWTIPNGKKHRIITLTDIELIEASSPEVDDVIRLQDDTGRGDGRIAEEHQQSKP